MRKSYLDRLPETGAAPAGGRKRAPGTYGGYLRAACIVPLLMLASVFSYAQTGAISGGGNVASACQGTANVLVYSFSLAQTVSTNGIYQFSFVTTAGTAANVSNYYVYVAPSSGNSLSTVPTNAHMLGQVNNLGVGTQQTPYNTGSYYQLNSGTTYYFYITANIQNAATVGSTVVVSAPTTSSFSWQYGESSAGATATSGTTTVTSCPCSQYYSFNGNLNRSSGTVQTFTVPPGCTQLSTQVAGAVGGTAGASYGKQFGGNGGKVTSTLAVTPGSTLYIYVGNAGGVALNNGSSTSGIGGSNSNGGAHGGNGSYFEGGGGGGSSDIRTSSGVLSSRVVMAAGGGGGGDLYTYSTNQNIGGAGGNYSGAGGQYGWYYGAWNSSQCGYPGTLSGGGTGSSCGTAGSLGYGGDCGTGNYGGGGGGGYYGAGGGCNGGACGGSSYALTGSGVTVSGITYNDGTNNGSGYVIITPLAPTAATVNGGGLLCGGGTVPVGLTSSVSGVNYQLYSGATAIGSPVVGTGSALTVGNVSAVGTYSVAAYYGTNTACTYPQTGTVSVTLGTAPAVFTVSGGGNYCSGGVTINLNGSESGVNYQLKNGATNVGSALAGTGGALTYSSVAGGAGTYTVLATNAATGCTSNMSGSAAVTVSSMPTLTSASNGGPICATNTLTLNANGAANVTGYAWSGPGTITGGTTATASVAAATTANSGIYTVIVNNGAGVGCTATYTTSATVNALPAVFTLTGGGPYCVGGAGSAIGLSSSQTGVNYQLKNGATNVGAALGGTGGAISMGTISAAGTYSIQASNATTGCSSSMSGSTTIVINAAPSLTSATNGGTICSGNTLALNANGPSNVTGYAWTGPVTVTNSGLQNATVPSAPAAASGTYTVTVSNGTGAGCSANYTTTALVNQSPTVFSVTGGGTYCTGGTGVPVGVSGSTSGIQYQLYRGSTPVGGATAGTGSALSFGLQTIAGTYSISATNTGNSCVSGMSGATSVSTSSTPNVYAITGGGTYCAGGTGVTLGLSNSDATVSYQVYNGSTAIGTPIPGSGSPLSLGSYTAAGTYSVVANAGSTCATNMTGTSSVGINAVPTAFSVTGGGSYCTGASGMPVGVSFGVSGIQYTLYNGSSIVTIASGSNAALNFGNQSAAGTYSVSAQNPATGCSNNMTGTVAVSVNATPSVFTATGGGSYCSGGSGVVINLNGSTAGVTYQLYNGGSLAGSAVAGTGSPITFGNQTAGGTYSVLATTGSSCTAAMTGTPVVIVNANPTVFTVTGGATYCSGGAGSAIGLPGSASGVTYQLYNGSTALNSVAGTGSAVSFGTFTASGTYTVSANNSSTGCTAAMSGGAVININATPTPFAVTGTGSYCSGGTGVPVGLANSVAGVTYQLYNGAVAGSTVSGTGSAITFGNQTTAGVYTVLATNTATGCTSAMTGSAAISINALPTAFTITGGGAYCTGGTGVAVGLSGSASGVSYTLYNGATSVGTAVAGTGAPIALGTQTLTGTYTVFALNSSTGCSSTMTGTATVSTNPLPTAFGVSGGGSYCSGGTGVTIGLSSSTSGVNYSLYYGSTLVSGASGSGSSVSFGNFTSSGTYTVQATNASTGCTAAMTGSASVSVNSVPTTYTVSGGGNYCSGGTGSTVTLSGSTSGVNYTLYNGSSSTGVVVAGTGSSFNFPAQTAAGTYTVAAAYPSTGCAGNMSGSAVITVLPIPATFTVTGGGNYCSGGTGVNVSLNGSTSGVNYQLYNGATAVGGAVAGTGAALSFGNMTSAGTYTVRGTNTANACINGMSGAATVAVNALPTAYVVSGGGNYCAGSTGLHVYLGNSTLGVNYQLYNGSLPTGSPVAGSGAGLDFGVLTSAGTYSVQASNGTTGCAGNMSGTAVINVNAVPTSYNVTGGGQFCSGGTGVSVGLAGSSTGINYQLMTGSTAVGSPLAGTGSALDFGVITTGGIYNVVASNGSTSCTSNMSGSATVTVNSLPTVYTVTGGGTLCNGAAGVNVGLSSSNIGVAYQLYNGASASGSPVAGTGLALDFGAKTAGGNYTVMAINTSTTCTNAMFGSSNVTVYPNPTVYAVTGGGQYCSGGSGVAVGLGGSTPGVDYQLYSSGSPVGAPVSGTGGTLSFGLQTAAGTYTVAASNSSTSCASNMTGSAAVAINALPTAYSMTGGGNFCSGGTGVTVGLNGSNLGVSYQLYNGASTAGSPLIGTNGTLNFGAQNTAGTYYVVASNLTTGCTNAMAGASNVGINAAPTAYVVTGGGNYCSGSTGMSVGLSGSNSGIYYQLYNGSTTVGGPMAGTGGALDFGAQTTTGSYNVIATNASTTCTNNMIGAVSVGVNALPTTYTVTGGGNFCTGGSGVSVGLSASNTGINYQLYNGSTTVGSAVAGTGGVINFGTQSSAGTYTVLATNTSTNCANGMTGSATIGVNVVPATYTVTGGGSLCSGDAGVVVGLGGSNTGISYQLYSGAVAMGSPVTGTGGAISFSPQTAAGTYSVMATNTSTGCTNGMTGTAAISVNSLPTVYNTTGGGTFCAGAAGVTVNLSGSNVGVNYQLYGGTTALGSPVAGTGSALSFGPVANPGSYNVVATNATTGCTRSMSGAAAVNMNPAPTAYTTTGGGGYCVGGSGVAVGLSNSNAGITYQLFRGSTPLGTVAGTGSPITFGLQTAAGTYSVAATNGSTTCANNMTGTATVSINTAPNAYTVLALSSSYCEGGAGVNVLLSGSDVGTSYQLYNTSIAIGSPVPGTGAMLDFGPQTMGAYMVVASSGASCTANMTGGANIAANPLPIAYTVGGNGGYCAGGAGSVITLSGSTTGVSYQLFRGSTMVGAAVAGTGTPISFAPQTTVGSYMVVATNTTTGCSRNMTGTLAVSINPVPTVQTVIGGGQYCSGSTGVTVGLGGSATGVNYGLYNGSTLIGTLVGTGSALTFGPQTAPGVYTVMATNATSSCTKTMTGSATVVVNPLPNAYAVTGGGNYCVGSVAGVPVLLGNSAMGVTYQLYNGTTAVGGFIAGTGTSLDFGMQATSGVYSIRATDATTLCSSVMSGSATINANAAPAVFTVTGGGNYCSGGTGVHVGLDGSGAGISYRMYNGATAVGAPMSGTGSALDFGSITAAGTYTVLATNTATSCVSNMNASAAVVIVTSLTPTVTVATGVGDTMCHGILTTFTATPVNGGAAPTYQWQVNGVNVGLGIGSYTYLPTNGDIVSVQMTSSSSCAIPSTAVASKVATVLVSQLPVANMSTTPNDTTCMGTPVSLSVVPAFGGSAPAYTWMKNGVPVASGTANYTYTPTNGDVVYVKMASNYRCRLADLVEGTHVTMVVDSLQTPVVGLSTASEITIVQGQTVNITAVASKAGHNPQYQWYLNSAPVPGATTNVFSSSNLHNNDSVTCLVTNISACAPTTGYKSTKIRMSTGIESASLSSSDIKLLPNPNKGEFIVRGTLGTSDDQELTAEVTNMLGQVVYRANLQVRNGNLNERIMLNNTLANGMYMLSLRSANENKVFHFVLEQ